jgi:hypothetical protein
MHRFRAMRFDGRPEDFAMRSRGRRWGRGGENWVDGDGHDGVRERWSRRGVGAGVAAALIAAIGVLGLGANRGMGMIPPPSSYVVFGYNELGMHCMNEDFSELMILPPFNTIRAQVIRRGIEPQIVTSGVTVKYGLPGNTHSSDKTNFWTFAPQLFGATFPPDVGLTGHTLNGTMVNRSPTGLDWEASGVPVTPLDDSGRENPYPLALISVERNGAVVAQTQAVVPVSWEISCNVCHNTQGISVATDILRKHDTRHGTHLETSKPVNCSQCHSDNALGAPGQAGVSSLSAAMHGSHSTRMAAANLAVDCYACHPGIRTQCQRDIHLARGMTCNSCHVSMAAVGSPTRRPWLDEPSCRSCHQSRQPEFDFEPAGVLFREATGHGGVKCVTCHNSPHATTPTTTAIDNLQATRWQGHPGAMNTCTACHTATPSEQFEHKFGD